MSSPHHAPSHARASPSLALLLLLLSTAAPATLQAEPKPPSNRWEVRVASATGEICGELTLARRLLSKHLGGPNQTPWEPLADRYVKGRLNVSRAGERCATTRWTPPTSYDAEELTWSHCARCDVPLTSIWLDNAVMTEGRYTLHCFATIRVDDTPLAERVVFDATRGRYVITLAASSEEGAPRQHPWRRAAWRVVPGGALLAASALLLWRWRRRHPRGTA